MADENRLNGSVENIYIWKDQAARLSTKAIGDLYVKNSLNHEDQRNLEQGFYVLKQSDIDFAKQNRNAFWERILSDSTERNTTLQARTKAGYTNDISTLRAGKKILILGQKSIQKVEDNQKESLKKLIALAKICGANYPSDFGQKMATTILMENADLKELVKLEKKDLERLELLSDMKKKEMKTYLEGLYAKITRWC